MDDDKRTKLGTLNPPFRGNTGSQPATAAAATMALSSPTPAPQVSQTSYLPPQVDPMLGQILAGRYHILKKLGEGGMGAVYLATHQLLEKQVALKVLHGEFARKPDLVERFMQEAKAASRIRHENVIDISDFGSTPEGMVFFAMEHLKGHDLHEEIARARLAGELLPWARSKRIFLQICGALQAAHALGIVHRDLKPENIYLVDFLGEPDFVKLLDFGIAKLTEVVEGAEPGRKLTKTGMLFGTPEYMSPEQARGENVDHRVDVYAMGCILFQLVSGRVPFEAENFMGVLSLHLTEPPPQIPVEVFDRIGAPRELAGVIERALLKDRNQRFGTIEELATAVRVVSGDPLPSGPTGGMSAQRVQAPAVTTQRSAAQPNRGPAPGTAPPYVAAPAGAATTGMRVKTQWTGNLNVPAAEEGRRSGGSKLPWILLGLLLVGGAAATVVVLGSKKDAGPATAGPGSAAVGSNPVAVVTPDAGSAAAVVPPPLTPDAAALAVTVVPDAAPEVALEPLPAQAVIVLDSKPHGATVYENGQKLGKTPYTRKLPGAREARSYRFVLSGYSEVLVDLAPNKALVNDTEELVKGSGGTPIVRHPGTPGPGPGPGPETHPGTDPTVKPPDGPGPEVKPPPPPEDECPGDLPCIKKPKQLDPNAPTPAPAPPG